MNTERRTWKVEEKCRAVLAVWTERGKVMEICREMGIGRRLLDQWQDRAMEGMLEALETARMRGECAAGPVLGNMVRKLLEKKTRLRESGFMPKLERKLTRLQEGKTEALV